MIALLGVGRQQVSDPGRGIHLLGEADLVAFGEVFDPRGRSRTASRAASSSSRTARARWRKGTGRRPPPRPCPCRPRTLIGLMRKRASSSPDRMSASRRETTRGLHERAASSVPSRSSKSFSLIAVITAARCSCVSRSSYVSRCGEFQTNHGTFSFLQRCCKAARAWIASGAAPRLSLY